jgi:uncharacterized membrane protein YeaQ/YmgE (transglycosylase-associated protein family)
MGIIIWIVVGLVAGLIARALLPGPQPMGLVATTLLGLAGSLIGGFIGYLVSGGRDLNGFHSAGLIGSIIGAIVLLFIQQAVSGRRHRATV